MNDLSDLMKEVRNSTRAMNEVFGRILGRSSGFRGFPNMHEGDYCAILTPQERRALAQVREDAMAEEETGGFSLQLLELFADELYHPNRIERNLMDEKKAEVIRGAVIPYMDTRPGHGYALPAYLQR